MTNGGHAGPQRCPTTTANRLRRQHARRRIPEKHGLEDEKENEDLKDSSLKGKALERATHPDKPRAGSPHDWEDWEKFEASEKQRREADADK